jgi:hypothetical protein
MYILLPLLIWYIHGTEKNPTVVAPPGLLVARRAKYSVLVDWDLFLVDMVPARRFRTSDLHVLRPVVAVEVGRDHFDAGGGAMHSKRDPRRVQHLPNCQQRRRQWRRRADRMFWGLGSG